eukprot:TRINITY_DN19662_c0_g1_i1.p1 TRINITY_DN19662_c0_g1~~TRINITY_DN19662_c0_g1_i1.p1  ORF type:complete len:475 (+),score=75.25 TRINITY_DN19662_c0_g1_i1:216-1427(+)
MPESCFFKVDCPHVSETVHNDYKSTQEWASHVKQSFGLEGSATIEEIGVTLSASYGSSSDVTRGSDKSSFYVETYNRQACYSMSSDCISNPTYLDPSVMQVASGLSTNATDDHAMEPWVQSFIKRFGSHISVASEHGAKIRSLTSVALQTQTSSDCLKQSACAGLSYLVDSAKLCEDGSKCEMHKGAESTLHTSCVIVGGDAQSVAVDSICSKDAKQEDVEKFLKSGDMTAGSSVIRYTLKPIADVIRFMGNPAAASALEKAVEYHACSAPRYSWTSDGNGQFGCQCVLSCENGAALDADSCTCKCRGDAAHGWDGQTCHDTYGTCQPGRGSGNPGSVGQCSIDNTCSSWTDHNYCQATDMCCLTDFGGTCCPFGSSCSCGVGSCRCVPGLKTNETAQEPVYV